MNRQIFPDTNISKLNAYHHCCCVNGISDVTPFNLLNCTCRLFVATYNNYNYVENVTIGFSHESFGDNFLMSFRHTHSLLCNALCEPDERDPFFGYAFFMKFVYIITNCSFNVSFAYWWYGNIYELMATFLWKPIRTPFIKTTWT